MPAKPRIFDFESFRGQDCTFLARLRLLSGAFVTQSAIEEITVSVVRDGAVTTVDEDDVDVDSSVFDSLQAGDSDPDPRWDDRDGYNFSHSLPGDAFPQRGHYRVEYTFTETSGAKWKLIFEGAARSSNG